MDDDPVAVLRRWEDTGAVWRVVARHDRSLTIALFTCDGGEQVQRLTSSGPSLAAYVAGRESSEDPPPRTGGTARRC